MTLPIVRPVANVERFSLARANAGIYYNVLVGPRLQPQTRIVRDESQWHELLKGPLTWLIQQHPVLSVVIGDHLSAKPVFLRMPAVELSRVIRVVEMDHPQEITKVLEEEHGMVFDIADHSVPLWRIVVAHVKEDGSFFVLYNFQHTIGDGRSAMGLTEQLVERLNLAASETEATALPSIVIPPNSPLAPSIEELANCYPSYTTLAKEATMGLLLPGFIKKALEKKYWAGEFDATLAVPHETQVGGWFLTSEESRRVMDAAKRKGTTVHSVMFTASMFAIKAVFLSNVRGDMLSTTKDAINFATPVSLRSLISPPINRFDQGSYTSEIMTPPLQIQLDTGFWHLTEKFHKQIREATTTPQGVKAMLEHAGLLEFLPTRVGGWEDFLRDQVVKEQHGRQTTLKLSNLGKAWDQPQGTVLPFKVMDALFSQSASTVSSAFTLNAATANGVLSLIATWQKQTFSCRDRAELYLGEFRRILLDATLPRDKEYPFSEALSSMHKEK